MNVNIDLNIISHIVLDDKVFYTNEPVTKIKEELGGPVSYASMVVPLLTKQVTGITSIGQNFPKRYIKYFESIDNYKLKFFLSKNTTRFLHEIKDQKREMFLHAKADILDDFIQSQNGANSCLLSPVFDEISKSSIKWALENHNFTGVDIQGFMRKKDNNKRIFSSFDKKLLNWIAQSVDIVKYSYNEASNFTQENSLKKILDSLPSNNIQIITMGSKGLSYSNKGKCYTLSAPAREEMDPTGSGDVLMTYLLAEFGDRFELDYLLAYGMALVAEKVKHHKIEVLPRKNYKKIAEEILETKTEIK